MCSFTAGDCQYLLQMPHGTQAVVEHPMICKAQWFNPVVVPTMVSIVSAPTARYNSLVSVVFLEILIILMQAERQNIGQDQYQETETQVSGMLQFYVI